VFANKQDLPNALSVADISNLLGNLSLNVSHEREKLIIQKLMRVFLTGLSNIKNRQWAIFKSSAIKGSGLNEGLEWLTNTIRKE
jgi:ADP-ribosylation factor-like protein 1